MLRVLSLIIIAATCALPSRAGAEMTSGNYSILSDSIGVNGGNFSSSTSYSLNDTVGDSPIGIVSSTTYTISGGFQSLDRSILSMSISSASLSLGEVSSASVASAATTVTITSQSDSGYILSVSSVSGNVTFTTDGSVTAGSSEYGVAVSGSHAAYGTDATVVSGLVLASASTAVVSDATILTFKAARATGASETTYSQTVTLTASANL